MHSDAVARDVSPQRLLGHQLLADLSPTSLDDLDRVVEASHDVKAVMDLVEGHATRSATDGREIIRTLNGGIVVDFEGWILEFGPTEDTDLGGTEGRNVDGIAVARDRRLHRRRQTVRNLTIDRQMIRTGVRVQIGIGDVLVQMLHILRRTGWIDNRHTRFGKVTLHSTAAVGTGAFEANIVRALGVRDVDLPARRVDDHVEQDGANRAEDRPLDQAIRLHREDVVIRQQEAIAEGKNVVPGTTQGIDPVTAVQLDDDAGFGGRIPVGIVTRTGHAPSRPFSEQLSEKPSGMSVSLTVAVWLPDMNAAS